MQSLVPSVVPKEMELVEREPAVAILIDVFDSMMAQQYLWLESAILVSLCHIRTS
jgi:hypothetical protein